MLIPTKATVVTSTSSRKHQRDSGCSIQHDAARKGGERRFGEADGDSRHQFTEKGGRAGGVRRWQSAGMQASTQTVVPSVNAKQLTRVPASWRRQL